MITSSPTRFSKESTLSIATRIDADSRFFGVPPFSFVPGAGVLVATAVSATFSLFSICVEVSSSPAIAFASVYFSEISSSH